MKLSIGIVGLPNVGKSTLFNALLKKSLFAKASEGQAGGLAKIGNYPFTTINPNIGIIEVPDERLPVLAKIVNTTKIVPAVVEFYDIAGLVKGASRGEGLGNKFLSHIREVTAIVHVVRLFEDSNVVHVSDKINPIEDIQTIENELMLADLETLQKQREPKGDTATKDQITMYRYIVSVKEKLNQGIPVRNQNLDEEIKQTLKSLNLLTLKPVIYLFNVSEEQLTKPEEVKKKIEEILQKAEARSTKSETNSNSQNTKSINSFEFRNSDFGFIYLCAKLESEVVALSPTEQIEYLNQYGLSETGLNRLIKKAYETLGLISFLTAGEIEARAWTITKGTFAPQAAGVIHTDFEKKFIKADVVKYENFVKVNGWVAAREKGLVQTVGKDYIMQDEDVVEFKVGA